MTLSEINFWFALQGTDLELKEEIDGVSFYIQNSSEKLLFKYDSDDTKLKNNTFLDLQSIINMKSQS